MAQLRPRVVIIGGGFAGLSAAKSLRRAEVEVCLVDRRNFHLFQPLLYQVATGELSPANIASPLRGILRKQKNARVLLGEVKDISLDSKTVQLTDQVVPFDYLILAAGSTHHYFGNEHWSKLAPGLKTVENATEIRRQILGAFEAAERATDTSQIKDMLTFVVVGAGPTGCELAGALSEVAYHTLRHDFRNIDPRQTRIILVEASGKPLEVYAEPLPTRAAEDLHKLGVEIIANTKVVDIQPTHVTICGIEDEQTRQINTRTVIWGAGVKGVELGEKLCASANIQPARDGRVPVNSNTSLETHPNVFVCGDLASFQDEKRGELPGLAPVATQMGRHAGRSIVADLHGKPRKPFRYKDKGSLAVIGRYSAVGEIGGYKAKGFIAWFLWLAVHLMYITMFRNRALVLIQWGWTFLSRDRSARLIADGPSTEVPTMEVATGWDEDPVVINKDT